VEGGPRAVGSLVLRPARGVLRAGEHTFAGELRWHRGRLLNVLTLENYVLGVLRGELPLGRVPTEAAAAQAIAARSYTLHYLDASRTDFDVDDTVLYQRYVGLRYAPDDDSLREGVRRSAGLYLSYRDAPLKAYYHSTCGGHTTDVRTGLDRPGIGPMGGVPCDHCEHSKYFRWSVRLEDAVVAHPVRLPPPLERLEILRKGPGGRARELLVVAENGREERIHAAEFRLAAGPSRLRSTLLHEIRRVDGGFEFRGGGWGHGVGLCQMGAIGLADQGLGAREIVGYYYPGAELRRAY
jgi:stage II sporulation protein D